MEEWRGNDDEAICAPASGERKSRLLRRAPHPTSPFRTPRNDTVWASSTVLQAGIQYSLARKPRPYAVKTHFSALPYRRTPRFLTEAGRCFLADLLSLFEQNHRVLGGDEIVERLFELLVFIGADRIVGQRHAR